MKEFTLILSDEDIIIIGQALVKRPFEEVAALISKIDGQTSAQESAQDKQQNKQL